MDGSENSEMGTRRGWIFGLFAALLAFSCSRSEAVEPVPDAAASASPLSVPRSATTAERPADPAPVYDFVANLARCDAHHRGALIDLGSPAADGLDGSFALTGEGSPPVVERDGATWAALASRAVTYRFVQDISAPVTVSVRGMARAARRVSVTLDGQPLGVLPLDRKQARVTSTRPTSIALPPGEHTVGLRFIGTAKGGEPFADIDWIRIAPSESSLQRGSYAPPTLRELSYSASLGGIPHRTIALRAPASVRCTTAIAKGASLRFAVGFAGHGEGTAEVRALRDGQSPVSLGTFHVTGGEAAKWKDVELPLDGLDNEIVALELSALSSAPTGKLLFGDPLVVVRSEPPPPPPKARLVVVVALSSIEPSRFPPHSEEGALPVLEELRSRSTIFRRHRSPSSITSASMASLLTGMSPRRHGLEDLDSRLPDRITTIAEAARDGSVQTAMFTGSPTSFAAFGFDQGWDRFSAISPVSGISSTAPLLEAAAWVSHHMKDTKARALVVVHARGGHPPWDVTGAEASDLMPPDYSGSMEPRRSAQVIGRARSKKSRFRLTENDRIRMWELYEKGLAGQDRALGALVEALRKEDLWKDTMFILTSDVGVPGTSRAPFGEGEDLDEASLEVPLWVRFAGGELRGVEVDTPTAVTDISRTVLSALGLGIPKSFEGVNLFATATSEPFPAARPLGAILESSYSVRWKDFLLQGGTGRTPFLCDLSLDPSCESDRLAEMPIVSRAMFRWIWDADNSARQARIAPREPATIDPDTAAALSVWGL